VVEALMAATGKLSKKLYEAELKRLQAELVAM
jgi:hypothetical protein